MTEKDLHKLLKKIDEYESLDALSEIVSLMKNIVVEDKNMAVDDKMRFLFLYFQYRNESNKHKKSDIKLPKKGVLNRIFRFLLNKKSIF